MSSSKGSKHKQQHGRSRVPVPPEQQQPPAAPNTGGGELGTPERSLCLLCMSDASAAAGLCRQPDLAKLLGNRTRALAAFEDSAFDAGSFLSAYLASLSEKAIDNARQDLSTLLASCTDEVGASPQHTFFMHAIASSTRLTPVGPGLPALGAQLTPCQVEGVVQQHHARFLAACSGVEALEDQVMIRAA
jgi:hypothetical protein